MASCMQLLGRSCRPGQPLLTLLPPRTYSSLDKDPTATQPGMGESCVPSGPESFCLLRPPRQPPPPGHVQALLVPRVRLSRQHRPQVLAAGPVAPVSSWPPLSFPKDPRVGQALLSEGGTGVGTPGQSHQPSGSLLVLSAGVYPFLSISVTSPETRRWVLSALPPSGGSKCWLFAWSCSDWP